MRERKETAIVRETRGNLRKSGKEHEGSESNRDETFRGERDGRVAVVSMGRRQIEEENRARKKERLTASQGQDPDPDPPVGAGTETVFVIVTVTVLFPPFEVGLGCEEV